MKRKNSSHQTEEPMGDNWFQLSRQELVAILIKQQEIITGLTQEIERLKLRFDLDSKNSSKPPSSDLLKKSQKKPQTDSESEPPTKKKPGGQPGHKGKTRKGFGRVDRIEVLRPVECSVCGGSLAQAASVKVEIQQVAQLVERPIEIVEYQRHHCQCLTCGGRTRVGWPVSIIPGQDLGVRLQGFLGWLANYGHLPYSKQQEMLWELGRIHIGVGTLVNTNQRLAASSLDALKALQGWINRAKPHLHVDETPWGFKLVVSRDVR